MKKTIITVFLILGIGPGAWADHEADATRAEAEPAKQRCAEKIGQFSLGHKGRGLFYRKTYEMTFKFNADGSGFSLEYDLGQDKKN